MAEMRTPPATPMTRKLVKRMVQVEENLKEVLQGAASEYVIEIKIRKIPATKAFSPINEIAHIEDVHVKVNNVTNEESSEEKSKLSSADDFQKGDVSSELQPAEVGLETNNETQEEEISPESSLALAMIEKEIIPSSRKLRRNGNRRSIKVKKFGSKESENKALSENIDYDVTQKQNESMVRPLCLKNGNDVHVAEDKIVDIKEAIPIQTHSESQKEDITEESIEGLCKPPEIISESMKEVSEQHEQILGILDKMAEYDQVIDNTEVTESVQQIVEEEVVASEPVENESEMSELVSDCDDTISDAEDVTFSEDLTPDLFRSNIRSELAELAMELIGSEPALADLANQLATQEPSPEPISELVATPDLPDLAEIKQEKIDLKRVGVISEILQEKESSEISSNVEGTITERLESSTSEVGNGLMEVTEESKSSEILSQNNEVATENPLEKVQSELSPQVDRESVLEISSDKESSELISEMENTEKESNEEQIILNEEKESSELLLSEVNSEEKEASEEKEDVLQTTVTVGESVTETIPEGVDTVTLDEAIKEDSYEEKDIVITEQEVVEHVEILKEDEEEIEDMHVEIQMDDYEEEEIEDMRAEMQRGDGEEIEVDVQNEIEDTHIEMQKEEAKVTDIANNIFEESPVIQQRRPPTLSVTQAKPSNKKVAPVKSNEMKYFGCMVAIFFILFYILTLMENSQAPPVYNV